MREHLLKERPDLEAIALVKRCGCDCMVEVKSVERIDNTYWHTKLSHKPNCHMDIDKYFSQNGHND